MRSTTRFLLPCSLCLLCLPWLAAGRADTPGPTATSPPAEHSPTPAFANAPPQPLPSAILPPGRTSINDELSYGRIGMLEIGGSVGLTMASEIRAMNFSPSIGWFFVDKLELSVIGSVANVKAGDESATTWSILLEPSYHLPFNRTLFGFGGLGMGAAYERRLGSGLAIAPRIGLNVLVGRAGVLSPSLSYEYITHNSMSEDDVTLVEVSSALRINVGYTTMW